MPRYDYRCSACGHIYEKREGFDAPSIQTCPTCTGEARRVLTPPAIVFKGSGWYVNDSRKTSPAAADHAPASTVSETPAAAAATAAEPKSAPAATKTETVTKPASTSTAAAAD